MKAKHLFKLLLFFICIKWCIHANAWDFVDNGIYYNILSEAENDLEYGTCEITYNVFGSTYSGNIEIPTMAYSIDGKAYKVIGIGDNAFYTNAVEGELHIPKSLKYIGESAFFETNITEIIFDIQNIDYNYCRIGDGAFGNCDKLQRVNFYGLFYHFGSNPFIRCDNLTSIEGWGGYTNKEETTGNTIIDGCLYRFTTTDKEVFNLELICCPSNKNTFNSPNSNTYILTSIGNSAFAGCSKITLLDIPSTVTSIGNYSLFMPADTYDSTYRKVIIPESVETTGNFLFGWFGYNWDIYIYGTNIRDIHYGANPKTEYGKYGTIHIPYGTISSFNVEQVGKAFNIIDDIENSSGEIIKKCATPTITFKNGEFVFSCETEGVEYHYEVSAVGKSSSGKLSIFNTYRVIFYAMKDGYEDSDIVTKEITVDNDFINKVGDANGDGVVDIADAVHIVNYIVGKVENLVPKKDNNQSDSE